MKNAMQLKAYIKNKALENRVSAQLVMQNYMLERLLQRISLSSFSDKLILKGGFLISAIVGIDQRTTMDMDTTIKNYPVTIETVKEMFNEICKIFVDDEITFNIKSVSHIREKDEYEGVRISLLANYPPMSVPLKVDVTTGDRITPKEIQYSFKTMFDNDTIKVLAYNLETILAEKLETIISRGIENTRPRDFYDIYILYNLQWNNINIDWLKSALLSTIDKRNSQWIVEKWKDIIQSIKNDTNMINQWNSYSKTYEYANDISFNQVCDTVSTILENIF